jgi:hypothetical protein
MLRRYLRATGVREFGESWIGVAGNRSPSPEVLEIHRLSSDSCAMSRRRVASMRHLEGLFERFG